MRSLNSKQPKARQEYLNTWIKLASRSGQLSNCLHGFSGLSEEETYAISALHLVYLSTLFEGIPAPIVDDIFQLGSRRRVDILY